MSFRTETIGQIVESSPRLKARIAGSLYFIIIIAGVFHYGFVRSATFVSGDASATAANILKSELLYRLGFVAAIILLCCNVPLALLFYDLFKVVSRSVSALVAFFTLVATAIETANLFNFLAPLIVLSGGQKVTTFNVEQLQSLAYVFLELQAVGFNVALVFFAFYDLSMGYLIYRSTFLPRVLGFLMAIGGVCYLTNSFANFLSPGFDAHMVPYIQVPSGLAELSLCLWLLVFGLNESRWRQQAGVVEEPQMKAAV